MVAINIELWTGTEFTQGLARSNPIEHKLEHCGSGTAATTMRDGAPGDNNSNNSNNSDDDNDKIVGMKF